MAYLSKTLTKTDIIQRKVSSYGFVIVLFLIIIIMSIVAPSFLTARNIMNLLRQVSIVGITACGATFVILLGEIDLSVGSVIALAGVLYASFQFFVPVTLAVLGAIAVGWSIGLLNGWIIAKTKIASFVITLGSMAVVRGLALLYANGRPIFGLKAPARWLGTSYIGPIPLMVILFLLIVMAAAVTLKMTKIGRFIYSIGGNEEASYLAGIKVSFYKTIAFAIAGLTASFGGVLLTSRLGSGDPIAAQGYEFDVIGAVVIGGTSLKGGSGTVIGTLLGTMLLGILTNGMNLLGVNPYWQQVAKGLIIIGAVLVDKQRQKGLYSE
ncbi:ABC transporter permease [Atrimonas thermophila]|uniref:ABC transporter permease n=1 Tax=Atrimonas thermophila TaxID=3064161 RepID=UPI00399D3E66